MSAAQADRACAFPWDEVLAFGFCVLRWPPEVLWAATPREIAAAAAGFAPVRSEAPGRDDMAALMAAFPDGQM